MFTFRQLVLSSFICLPLHSTKAMEAEENSQYSQYSQYSQNSSSRQASQNSQNSIIKKISSLEEIKEKVIALREKKVAGKNIIVILDFHGVVVNEEEHKSVLTLKDGIIGLLQYLDTENILYIIATAWKEFNDVIQEGIVKLGLQDFFDVNPYHTAQPEDFKLGSKKEDLKPNIQGYRNGNVVALKYMTATHTPYYRQKAFGAELCYPDADIHYMIFADDSKGNVEIFEEDAWNITQTGGKNFQELTLFFLENAK